MAKSKMSKALNEGMQIPCPKCLEPMNMAAQRCPDCKYDFSEEEVQTNIASKKAMPRGCLKIFGVILAIVAILVLVGVMFGLDQNTGVKDVASKETAAEEPTIANTGKMSAGDEYTWKAAAEQVVGTLLRDPDAAVYSDLKVYPGTQDKSTIICGYVNSPNAFGGMTGRQRFIVGGTVLLEEQFTEQQMSTAWTRLCK